MSSAVSRTPKRRRSARAGGGALSAFAIALLMVAGAYYAMQVIVTDDPLWFRTDFDAQPRHMVIQLRGVRTDIPPTDARFAPLVDAFNRSIERGYWSASMGFSDPTWALVEANGVIVETQYSEPVRLHGNFVPTTRMRVLLSGEQIHTTELLFRSNEDEWDRSPLRLKDVSLLAQAVQRAGLGE